MIIMLGGLVSMCCVCCVLPVLLYFVSDQFKNWVNGLLGTGQTKVWDCMVGTDVKGSIKLAAAPFTDAAATEQCKTAVPACTSGVCTVQAAKIDPAKQAYWDCTTANDGVYRGMVRVWWGHKEADGAWACNKWISQCGSSTGKCTATAVTQ